MADRRYQIIRGARLLDAVNYEGAYYDLLIDGDEICEIGPPGLAAPSDSLIIDAADQLLIPGLINAHTHGDVSLAKGLGDRLNLELLLNASPLTSETFRLEDKYLAAQLAAAEMLLSGCTACYDLFSEFPIPSVEGLMAVGQAYADVGMRATIAPLMADRNFWQAIPGLLEALPPKLRIEVDRSQSTSSDAAISVCRRALKDWTINRDRVRVALGPTIPYHCEPSFFRACRELADDFGSAIHTHVAESKVQAIVGMEKFGKSLTAHLDDLGVIGPNFTAAHAVWIDHDDIRILADRGASVAHNPTSNLRLGAGVAPVGAMLDAGLNVGVGTDASTCGDALNMFEAQRLANYLSRIHSPDPDTWFDAKMTLKLATLGSAQALGFGDLIGQLAPGFKADIVFLDLKKIQYMPLNNLARQVVYQESGTAVRHVMVGGIFVVHAGKLKTIDFSALRENVADLNGRVYEESELANALVQQLKGVVGEFCGALAQKPYHVNRLLGTEQNS